jgi:hypothetical protein
VGSIPIARSNSLNGLGQRTSGLDSRVSAECPRNVFPGRSEPGDPLTQEGKETALPATSRKRVRGRSVEPAAHGDCRSRTKRPAHPSKQLVAQFNERWRVVDDPPQWVLQRRKGNPRSKNQGWKNRSYCTTRSALLRCVREYCGGVQPAALDKLNGLPSVHSIQNLDVRGTDQAHADTQRKAPGSQGLEVTGTGHRPPRGGKCASS